ncbi:MAG: ABC transporter ATP-binding protein [Gammaproteobacteria bacterium]
MARIQLIDIAHSYDTRARQWALKPLTTTWEHGGAYALLGPSGCGKTTLLNIMSGLVHPTQGRVLFDDLDVTLLPPEARNIAQVFQFPIVYETMTMFENLAFPLRNRRWPAPEIRRRVHEVAEILELGADLGRRAHGLSAEIEQRLSLGRGLVRPDVAAVLFDEPLTVIDPHVKWLLRRKLKQIHQQLELSLVYVTHDQTEALTFADRVVVMAQGEILQTGSAEELFETPAHQFVGHFIGSPGMNFVACEWNEGTARIGSEAIRSSSTSQPGSFRSLALGIRPEHVKLRETAGANCVPARIVSIRDEGTRAIAVMQVAGQTLNVRLAEVPRLARNAPVFAHFPAERCALYADGRRVA